MSSVVHRSCRHYGRRTGKVATPAVHRLAGAPSTEDVCLHPALSPGPWPPLASGPRPWPRRWNRPASTTTSPPDACGRRPCAGAPGRPTAAPGVLWRERRGERRSHSVVGRPDGRHGALRSCAPPTSLDSRQEGRGGFRGRRVRLVAAQATPCSSSPGATSTSIAPASRDLTPADPDRVEGGSAELLAGWPPHRLRARFRTCMCSTLAYGRGGPPDPWTARRTSHPQRHHRLGLLGGDLGPRSASGYWWSPDGSRIAYYRFDERRSAATADRMTLRLYPEVTWQKYPKAGEPNPRCRIGVLDVASGSTVWLETGGSRRAYLARRRLDSRWRRGGRPAPEPRPDPRSTCCAAAPSDGACAGLLTRDLAHLGESRRRLPLSPGRPLPLGLGARAAGGGSISTQPTAGRSAPSLRKAGR